MAVKFHKVGDTWKPIKPVRKGKSGRSMKGSKAGEPYTPIPKLVRDELIANPTKSVDELLPTLRRKFPDSKQVCNRASWMRKLRLELVKAGKVRAIKDPEGKAKVKSRPPVRKAQGKKTPVKKVHSVRGGDIINRPPQ